MSRFGYLKTTLFSLVCLLMLAPAIMPSRPPPRRHLLYLRPVRQSPSLVSQHSTVPATSAIKNCRTCPKS